MTDKSDDQKAPIEENQAAPEATEPTTDNAPVEEPTTEPDPDPDEEGKKEEAPEEAPEEATDESPEEEVPATPELRIVNHESGQILVFRNGVRLNKQTAVAVFSAKGFTSLLQVVKSNRIKAGKSWEGSLEDLKDAPKGKKK